MVKKKPNIFHVTSLLKGNLLILKAKAKMASHLLMRDIAILKSQMKAKCRNTEQLTKSSCLKAGLSVTGCAASNHLYL